MSKITIVKTGWYHPSTANWSYGIWAVIDDTGAKLYKETFGGDYRMSEQMKAKGHEVKTLSVGCLANYKWKDIKGLSDIEEYTGKNY